METSINERIRFIIEKLFSGNKSALAKKIGEDSQKISNIYLDKTKASLSVVEKICSNIENINSKWLLFGIGKPFEDEKGTSVLTVVIDKYNEELVPLVPIYAYAGYLRGYSDPEFVKTLPIGDRETFKDGTYRDFEIKGDSMEEVKK